MTECPLCKQGDPSINVRCWNCGELFHIHSRQLNMAPEGSVVMADCPSCQVVNCWKKQKGVLVWSGPVFHVNGLVLDMRGKW